MLAPKGLIEIILSLLVAVIALATVARRVNVPYPIVMVLGGLGLAFVPGLPTVVITPDVVLLIFLPPLLYAASWELPWRDFRANLRPILLLSIGLVLACAAATAWVAHAFIPGISWQAGFTLGAIIAPTDAVAATAIARRMNTSRRIITILEGESIVNDATGLVAYQFAAAALASGHFSVSHAALRFVVVALGGIAVGLAVGAATDLLQKRLHDPLISITLSVVAGFAAYLPADALGFSGVLAVLAAGLHGGRQSSTTLAPQTRLQATALWDVLTFILNGLLFILLGLQLHTVFQGVSGRPFSALWVYALLVVATAIGVRGAWVFSATYLPRLLFPSLRRRNPAPSCRHTAVVAYAGMRGAVSLAAALAVPFVTRDGQTIAARALIVFLAYAVILATLVLQGFSLPTVLRLLKATGDPVAAAQMERARHVAVEALRLHISELRARGTLSDQVIEGLQTFIEERTRLPVDGDESSRVVGARRSALMELRRELIEVERRAILRARDAGTIDDESMRTIERELDLEDARL